MGCSNCSNGGGVPNGCKSNGSCGTGSCGKLSVFDWLADVELPNGQSTYDVLEIRFKNSRKGFYRNIKGINLQVGDVVAVDASPGYDVGIVSIVGELARIQVRKKTQNFKAHEARSILRRATKEDIEKWKSMRERESDTMFASRRLASELALKMKISDVEYQGDGNKVTFYYTADDRVDFRQLIRNLADEFRVKVEMKQIGVRQEAARLGGIGSCGRELCCSTWLTDFRSVSTASARYQQLSLNPQKLAGQCGKLKCCLNYELDAYLDALKEFPSSDTRLKTQKGIAFHVKTDVFKGQMWYIQEDKNNPGSSGFIPLTPERVKEIIKMNKEGELPTDLKDFMEEIEVEVPDYTDVVGQDSLNRFEHVFKRNKKRRAKKKRPSGSAGGNTNQKNQPKQANAAKSKDAKPQEGQKKRTNKNQGNKAKRTNNRPKNKSQEQEAGNQPANKRSNNQKPKPNTRQQPKGKNDDSAKNQSAKPAEKGNGDKPKPQNKRPNNKRRKPKPKPENKNTGNGKNEQNKSGGNDKPSAKKDSE